MIDKYKYRGMNGCWHTRKRSRRGSNTGGKGLPRPQFKQADIPTSEAYFPKSQGKQLCESTVAENLPAGQNAQVVEPVGEIIIPLGHVAKAVHWARLDAPEVDDFPGGQLAQEVAPAE